MTAVEAWDEPIELLEEQEREQGGQARNGHSSRVPPHSLDAERALLGALLLSKDARAAVAEVLPPDADAVFYRPAHAHIYEAITVLTARGEVADPITVADELRRRDLLDAAGGTAALVDLQAEAPGTANAAHYARIVKDHSLLRRLIGAAGSISERAYTVPEDIASAVAEAEGLILDVARQAGPASSPALARLEAAIYDVETIQAIPPPSYLIDQVLVQDSTTMTYGPPGHGKSLAALGQAMSVACEVPWMGREVVGGPVVYVVAEGLGGVGQRVEAWRAHHGDPPFRHRLEFVGLPVNLFNEEEAAALIALCASREPVLVVIDTLARCIVGADENSARDSGIVIDRLDRLRRATGACVHVIHHSGKDLARGGRGNTAWEGAVDTQIECTMSGDTTTLKWPKCKDSAKPLPLSLDLREVPVAAGTSVVLALPDNPLDDDRSILSSGAMRTLAVLREVELPGGITSTVWLDQAEAEGIGRTTFFRHRKQLVDGGLVVNIGTGSTPKYLSKIFHEQEQAA